MADDDIGIRMIQELIDNHRNDHEGAVVKIEEWRGMINILERFANIARDHPDGWDHVLKMMKTQFSGEPE